ncbi:MAG: S-layer homology domain-containing protein [Clostridia bacterium]|nr:S-layer homology domain-containing protein [Clostridia bacterium]
MIPALTVNAVDEYRADFIVDGKLAEIAYTQDHKVKLPEGPFMEGYTFWGWVTDWVEAFDKDEVVTLTDDTKFYGVYDYNSYDVKLSTSSSTHATVTGVPGVGKYNDDFKFTVTPDEGYEIVSVTAEYWRNTIPVGLVDEGKYSFVIPSGDVTIKVVTREADKFAVKVENGTASADVSLLAGETYTLPSALNDSVTVPENTEWAGWKDADTSLVYAAGAVITANKDYHFVPAFIAVTEKEYVGTFYADGMMVSVLTTSGKNITMPEAPEKSGYTFVSWGSDNPAGTYAVGEYVTLADNAVFTANYTANAYDVTLDSASSADASVTGVPTTAAAGEQVKFTTSAAYGCVITGVSVVNELTHELIGVHTATPNAVNGAEYFFTMPAAPVSVKVETMGDAFNVIYLDADGAFISGEKVPYMDAAHVSNYISGVTAEKAGCHFAGWVSADTKTPVTVPSVTDSDFVVVGKTYIKAVFEKDEVDVLFKSAEHGTVTELSTNHTAEYLLDTTVYGDKVSFSVAPDAGYRVGTVSITAVSPEGVKTKITPTVVGDTYSFVIPATYKANAGDAKASEVEVSVSFYETPYYLTMDIVGEATAKINGYSSYMTAAGAGSTVSLEIKPAEGWKLSSVVVNSNTIALNEMVTPEGGVYTFDMPANDVYVMVTLVKTGYTLATYACNFFEEGHGTITVSPKADFQVGDVITFDADPDDGYRVNRVLVVADDGTIIPTACLGTEKNYVEHWAFTMPSKNVTIKVTFKVNGSSYYTDVCSNFWFYDAVTFVTDRGYFKGISNDLFAPDMMMDRGMFVTVLGRIAEIDAGKYAGSSAYSDVKETSYYAPYVAWATDIGIVNGCGDGTFGPTTALTREEMTTIMYRVCAYIGCDVDQKNAAFLSRYTDMDLCADWARPAVEWAVGAGLIQGTSANTIAPANTVDRATVAQLIMNFCDKILFR